MAKKTVKVKFLSYGQIAAQAEEVLKRFNYEGIIPVPIERIIDFDLKINIVPFLNLFKTFDINAITSSDLKTIYVDFVLRIIGEKIVEVFQVSSKVIRIRMEKSNLVKRIPFS